MKPFFELLIFGFSFSRLILVTLSLSPGINIFSPTLIISDTPLSSHAYEPTSLWQDSSGNLYVSDRGNQAIYKLSPDNSVSRFAGDGLANSGLPAMDGTIAGNNAIFGGRVGQIWGDSNYLYYADDFGKVRTISFNTNRLGTIAGGGNVTSSKTFILGTRVQFRSNPSAFGGDDANGILYIGAGDEVYMFLKSTGMMKSLPEAGYDAWHITGIQHDPVENCLYLCSVSWNVRKLDLSPGGKNTIIAGKSSGDVNFEDGDLAVNSAVGSPVSTFLSSNRILYVNGAETVNAIDLTTGRIYLFAGKRSGGNDQGLGGSPKNTLVPYSVGFWLDEDNHRLYMAMGRFAENNALKVLKVEERNYSVPTMSPTVFSPSIYVKSTMPPTKAAVPVSIKVTQVRNYLICS
jgi:hypothetical protein